MTGDVSPEEQSMQTSTLVSLIVGINLFLVVAGGGVIWFLLRSKKPSTGPDETESANEAARVSFMQKIKGMLPAKKTKKEVGNQKRQQRNR